MINFSYIYINICIGSINVLWSELDHSLDFASKGLKNSMKSVGCILLDYSFFVRALFLPKFEFLISPISLLAW